MRQLFRAEAVKVIVKRDQLGKKFFNSLTQLRAEGFRGEFLLHHAGDVSLPGIVGGKLRDGCFLGPLVKVGGDGQSGGFLCGADQLQKLFRAAGPFFSQGF